MVSGERRSPDKDSIPRRYYSERNAVEDSATEMSLRVDSR